MKNDKKILSTREVISLGWGTIAATVKTTLVVAAVGMVVPQIALSLIFDAYSGGIVEEIRVMLEVPNAAAHGVFDLLAPALTYMGRFIGGILALCSVIMVSYFALVHVAVAHHRAYRPLSPVEAWVLGIKTALPRGAIVLVCLVLFAMIGQAMLAPAILIAVMSLVIPVILVTEGKGAFRSLWEALTLRYVRQSPYSGWTILFILLSLAALFYTGAALIGLLSQWLLTADQSLQISRETWTMAFPKQPFGPIYLMATLIEAVFVTALLAIFPALTAALYFLVVGRRKLGEA